MNIKQEISKYFLFSLYYIINLIQSIKNQERHDNMYFGIYDKDTIKEIVPMGNNSILIRILDKNTNNVEMFDNLKLYNKVHYIYTYDDSSFSNEQLHELNKFIMDTDFGEVAIHCNAGISRSSAIGICVARMLNSKAMENIIVNCNYFIPNKHILSILNNNSYQTKESPKEVYFRNPTLEHWSLEQLEEKLTEIEKIYVYK